jgi:hypothetical protein
MTKHRSGIMVHCPNPKCNYTWRYVGCFSFYATCPSYRRNVKIYENKVESIQPTQNHNLKPTEAVATKRNDE